VDQDFGVFDPVAGTDSGLFGALLFHGGIGQAFDGAAFIADKMGVFVAGGFIEIVHSVSPDLVIAADAMEQLFFGQGVERAIERDLVDASGHSFKNLRSAERLFFLAENFQDVQADGGSAQA